MRRREQNAFRPGDAPRGWPRTQVKSPMGHPRSPGCPAGYFFATLIATCRPAPAGLPLTTDGRRHPRSCWPRECKPAGSPSGVDCVANNVKRPHLRRRGAASRLPRLTWPPTGSTRGSSTRSHAACSSAPSLAGDRHPWRRDRPDRRRMARRTPAGGGPMLGPWSAPRSALLPPGQPPNGAQPFTSRPAPRLAPAPRLGAGRADLPHRRRWLGGPPRRRRHRAAQLGACTAMATRWPGTRCSPRVACP